MFDTSGARLLLVLAEPVLADLTSFRLELLGYQIEVVSSGAQASASLSKSLPDLIIVDTALADGDGIEWIAQARGEWMRGDSGRSGSGRGNSSSADIPIAIFSLDPSLETVERAFHAGVQDYLISPFDPIVMEEKIETLLTRHFKATRRRKPSESKRARQETRR